MENRPSPSSTGLALGDIYYTIFRHKWKIMLISTAGILAALGVYFFAPLPYQSEAKLFVRFVVEAQAPTSLSEGDARMKSPDRGGMHVISSELEILTSLDLAQLVADAVGPEKILGKGSGNTNRYRAGLVIQAGLEADVPKESDVIHVVFKSRNAEIVQPVLTQLVELYLKRSAELHRAAGVYDDFLTQQTDQLRSRLSNTEDELRAAKTKAGIVSLEDSKKLYGERISRIETSLLDAVSELAEYQATANEWGKFLHVTPGATNPPAQGGTTNLVAGTNGVAGTNPVASASEVAPPAAKIAEYKRLLAVIEGLNHRLQDLTSQYTPEHPQVKALQVQVDAKQKIQDQLESDYPGLLAVKAAESKPAAANNEGPEMMLATQMARVSALQAKIKVLSEQLDKIRKESSLIYDAEGSITELQRRRDLQETQYTYFERSLEQARINDQLGAGKNANITKIQEATPAARDTRKLLKAVGGILFGGIAAAFALAFVIDLFLDPSIKRPMEVEARLSLPLFVAVPRLKLKGREEGLLAFRPSFLLTEQSADGEGGSEAAAGGETNTEGGLEAPVVADDAATTEDGAAAEPVLQPEPSPFSKAIRPYHEALRDRLISWFEACNLTHKPKLVAVTGCANGAGVTTTAAGLAASLSETGDGNVLLVDMSGEGVAHEFFKGGPAFGLAEALEIDKRDSAQVRDHLYAVTYGNNSDRLPQAMPKRFGHLVPRLRASDYDYIVFDMPPISQISVTLQLARFMDMVLVVAESEKTDREVVKRACAMVKESQPNVGVVLNKGRDYVPRRLLQQI